MGRLVVVEHKIYRVRGRAYEDDLKAGVVERTRVVEGPEEIDVSCHIDYEVKELRFE